MGRLTNARVGVAPSAPRLRTPPKIAESFYLSPEWRRLVAQIKRERGAWCEVCGSTDRLIGDHIVERRDGGTDLDPMNIKLLCHRCHQRKTAAERAKRARGGT